MYVRIETSESQTIGRTRAWLHYMFMFVHIETNRRKGKLKSKIGQAHALDAFAVDACRLYHCRHRCRLRRCYSYCRCVIM